MVLIHSLCEWLEHIAFSHSLTLKILYVYLQIYPTFQRRTRIDADEGFGLLRLSAGKQKLEKYRIGLHGNSRFLTVNDRRNSGFHPSFEGVQTSEVCGHQVWKWWRKRWKDRCMCFIANQVINTCGEWSVLPGFINNMHRNGMSESKRSKIRLL